MAEVDLSEPEVGGYSVSLPTFEGPLDLLLHLCQKHELDILDIPISFVTEKYLEYLAVMQLINLDLASEYLVMAATLAHIKSKVLLPAPPPGQEDDALAAEEEDPREGLIRRLLEYQKYKQAGAELASRGVAGRDVFLRGMPLEEAVHTGVAPLHPVPIFSLVEAFQGVLEKSKIKLSHDVVHERITLTDRINELVDVLRVKRRVQFEELFTDLSTRFDLVITFLALLEMTKLRMTRLIQLEPMGPIFVEFSAQVGVDAEDGETVGGSGADAGRGAADGDEGGARAAQDEGTTASDRALDDASNASLERDASDESDATLDDDDDPAFRERDASDVPAPTDSERLAFELAERERGEADLEHELADGEPAEASEADSEPAKNMRVDAQAETAEGGDGGGDEAPTTQGTVDASEAEDET